MKDFFESLKERVERVAEHTPLVKLSSEEISAIKESVVLA
jgi:hypothetical protein